MQRSRCAGLSFALPLLLSTPSFASVIHVPGDYATIQAAIDAAVTGDVVEIACGTYQVPGIIMKSGITLRSATGDPDCVIVRPVVPIENNLFRCNGNSQTVVTGLSFVDGEGGGTIRFEGAPTITRCKFISNSGTFFRQAASEESALGLCSSSAAAIIFDDTNALVTDCDFNDNASSAGAIKACGENVFSNCRFNGNYGSEGTWGAMFAHGGTFRDCAFRYNHGYFTGAAANCYQTTFQRCVFESNWTGIYAGAVFAEESTFRECLFNDNWTGSLSYGTNEVGGGALYIRGPAPSLIIECTFWGNDASVNTMTNRLNQAAAVSHASAIWVSGSSVTVSNTIVNGNTGSEAVYCDNGGSISTACTNISGNPGGDWTGCIANQSGTNGNISVDPVFCDSQNGDFRLSSLSPCLYADCGAMGAFGQGCFDEKPALFHVKDVGNDQGRQVRLIWQRSLNDSPTANPFVIGYGVYRKREQFAKDTPLPETARGEGVAIPGWDYLGSVPSRGDSLYETVVPTLCDSTITNGQCLSTFFVSAMTQNPFVYWDSPPHSGYSKDNLAPPTPTGFGVAYNTGNGNRLDWDAVAAGDFAGFHVYRSLPPGQTASAGELVATTTQTTWTDPNFDGWNAHYEVTSFDGAGNESAPAIAGTTTPVPIVTPSQLDLLPNIPNPFNPSTTIRFTTPDEGAVRIAIYDARGSLVRVLVDKTLPAGHHDAIWDGRDGKGSPVSSGVYLCRLEQRSDFRTRKIVLIK